MGFFNLSRWRDSPNYDSKQLEARFGLSVLALGIVTIVIILIIWKPDNIMPRYTLLQNKEDVCYLTEGWSKTGMDLYKKKSLLGNMEIVFHEKDFVKNKDLTFLRTWTGSHRSLVKFAERECTALIRIEKGSM